MKVRFWRGILPFACVFALYLLLRASALGGLSVPLGLARTGGLSFLERMALMVPVTAHYLRLMVFPVGLRLEYDWASFPFFVTALSAVLIAAAIACGVWLWKREWRVAALGIAWFFVFLLPVSNIIPIGELVAERFLYLPSAGFCLFAGAMVERLSCRVAEPIPRYIQPQLATNWSWTLGMTQLRVSRLLFLFILSILFIFSFLTIKRNSEWRDPEMLWRRTLALSPAAPHASENLAALLLAKGDLEGAGAILDRMVQRFPEKPMTNYLMAQFHLKKSERQNALPFLERALEVAGPTNIAFTDFQRGAVLLELGRFGEALSAFEKAAAANPYDPALLNNLGVAQAKLGRVEEARFSFARAITLFEEQAQLSEEEQRNYEGAKENLRALQALQ